MKVLLKRFHLNGHLSVSVTDSGSERVKGAIIHVFVVLIHVLFSLFISKIENLIN